MLGTILIVRLTPITERTLAPAPICVGLFIGDIFFVILPNKRQLPHIRSVSPIDLALPADRCPTSALYPVRFSGAETGDRVIPTR
jgi:hypothetical protein